MKVCRETSAHKCESWEDIDFYAKVLGWRDAKDMLDREPVDYDFLCNWHIAMGQTGDGVRWYEEKGNDDNCWTFKTLEEYCEYAGCKVDKKGEVVWG